MDGRTPNQGPPTRTLQDKLDSWKAIAAYVKRDVTTVQRWERREGMPVHRHLHDKQGSVYAFCSELDTWLAGRRVATAQSEEASSEGTSAGPATGEAVSSHDVPHRGDSAEVAQTGAASQSDSGPHPGSTPQLGTASHPGDPPHPGIAPKSGTPSPPPASQGRASTGGRSWLPVAIGGALLAAALAAYWLAAAHDLFWRDPLTDAKVTQLTDLSETAQAAAISRDGRLVTFLAEGDGHTDAWIIEVGSSQYRNLTEGRVPELINPSIRTLGFSPDGKLVTVWSRKRDGSRPDDINILTVPVAGGALQSYLPGAAEVAYSSDGRHIVYHTTAPGDPLFVRDLRQSSTRQIYVAPAGVHCHFPLWSPDDAFIYFVRGVPPDDWDVWRIRPSGDGLERITHHDSRVSHPVLLDRRTLLYLASDSQRAGPWVFSTDVERRIPHRLNFGLEHYTSLEASADGTRLVATAANIRSSLSRLSITTTTARVVPLFSSGLSPRLGPDYLLYIASAGGRQGIWKLANGASRELWSTTHSTIVGGPSITTDGHRIAFAAADGERTSLYVMDSDGTHARTVTDSLALRGNLAWSPDGQSIVSAVVQSGEPRLTKIPVEGGAPLVLVSEYSLDPTWSPDGQFLLYSGPDVGTTFAVRAVAADGRPYPLPALILSRGARRVVFWRDTHSVVVLRGDVSHKNFWLVDLQTGAERQLAELTPEPTIGDFDVSRSGDEIVFDRVERSSEIALIERAR
jgi:Tol biopolymer transport system component